MAITVDQATLGTNAASGAGSTITLTTTNTVASNGFIVLGVGGWGADAAVSSVSGGGLTWTVVTDNPAPLPTSSLAWAPAPSGLASSTVITVTYIAATPSSRHVCGTSFLGVDLGDPLDVNGTRQSEDPGTAWTTGSLSIAAGSLIVGVSFNQDNRTSTPTAPSAELFDFGGAGTEQLTMAYRIESSAGSYAVAGTLSGSSTHTDIGAAFNAAAGGGGGTPTEDPMTKRILFTGLRGA